MSHAIFFFLLVFVYKNRRMLKCVLLWHIFIEISNQDKIKQTSNRHILLVSATDRESAHYY